MLKKIMLSVAAMAVLIGASNLIAQERRGRPQAKPRQRQKVQTEQPRRQRADRAAVRKRMENLRDEPEPIRPGQDQPGVPQGGVPAQPGQMFSGWLDELTEAYRADDREKMGQLLRKMHQLRQEWREIRGQGFQGRGMRRWDRGWQGRGIGRRGQIFQGRGMLGRWGQRFQGRGIGIPGPGMPPPPLMEKPEPPMPPEDIRKPRPDMPPRGMGEWGRGFQRRGMAGWGRGFPGPWCPWLRSPRPQTD